MKNRFFTYCGAALAGLLVSGYTANAQAPANDDCSGAVTLTVGATCSPTSGTTTGATGSSGIPDPDCATGGAGWDDDVWYTFTPAAGQTVVNITFASTGGSGDMVAQLYTSSDNTCAGNFVTFNCSDDNGPGAMPGFTGLGVTPNTTYYMRVFTYDSLAAGDFTVCVMVAPPPPANDECSGAFAISPSSTYYCTTPTQGSGADATMSADIPSCSSTPSNDIWFSFTPSDTAQNLAITNITATDATVTTDFSYGVAIYSGTCGSLTPVDCSSGYGGSDLMLHLTGLSTSSTYYIQVFGDESYNDNFEQVTTGINFDLCLPSSIPALTNDEPANAIAVTVDQPCSAPYYNNGATVAAGEPGALCTGASDNYATVWFKFIAPSSGAVKITTDFSGYTLTDTRIALFSVGDSTNYSTFQSLACDEDNGIIGDGYNSIMYAAGLTSGTEYYIVVDQYSSGTNPGTFCLEVNTLSDTMLPAAGSCTAGQQNGASNKYMGWLSLVDNDGKLIANVRPNPAATYIDNYNITPSLSIHQGTPRQDANGLMYLNRNGFFEADIEDTALNTITAADMDLQLFFTQAELTALGTPLSGMNVTHNPGAACSEDFSGDGSQTALLSSGRGTSGNASWIDITTPGFSNFYLMGGATPLPIELISITATNAGSSNRIDWSTGREDAGEYFELERSADSKTFGSLGRVAGKGPGSAYTYWDRSPLKGTGYYRLKMINNDGKIKYSKIVEAVRTGNAAFSLKALPNPVSHTLWVTFGEGRGDKAVLSLSDATGKILRTYSIVENLLEIDMSGLVQGLYVLRYADGIRTETMKVSKQ